MLSETERGKLNNDSIKKFSKSATLVKDLGIQQRLEKLKVSKRIRDLQAANIDVKSFKDHDDNSEERWITSTTTITTSIFVSFRSELTTL